jgi:hypothetical protein
MKISEIWACPLRGRHIPGFASLGASHASPLHAAHAPPPPLQVSSPINQNGQRSEKEKYASIFLTFARFTASLI